MEPIGKDLARIVGEAARNLAVARHLVASDGVVYCWGCVALQRRSAELSCEEATLPVLHCPGCLTLAQRRGAGHYVRRVVQGVSVEYPTEPDEKRRWRLLLRNMRSEERLDREGASRMLANAKALPGAFEGDVRELTAAFHQRFGHHDDAGRPSRAVRYRDAAE